MKISAQMALVIGVVFALICFGVAVKGFLAVGDLTDAKQIADSWGFAWFWAFLGFIGVLFAGVSWWIIRTHKDEEW